MGAVANLSSNVVAIVIVDVDVNGDMKPAHACEVWRQQPQLDVVSVLREKKSMLRKLACWKHLLGFVSCFRMGLSTTHRGLHAQWGLV